MGVRWPFPTCDFTCTIQCSEMFLCQKCNTGESNTHLFEWFLLLFWAVLLPTAFKPSPKFHPNLCTQREFYKKPTKTNNCRCDSHDWIYIASSYAGLLLLQLCNTHALAISYKSQYVEKWPAWQRSVLSSPQPYTHTPYWNIYFLPYLKRKAKTKGKMPFRPSQNFPWDKRRRKERGNLLFFPYLITSHPLLPCRLTCQMLFPGILIPVGRVCGKRIQRDGQSL